MMTMMMMMRLKKSGPHPKEGPRVEFHAQRHKSENWPCFQQRWPNGSIVGDVLGNGSRVPRPKSTAMSWASAYSGRRCAIQENYHKVSLEIPFGLYLPEIRQKRSLVNDSKSIQRDSNETRYVHSVDAPSSSQEAISPLRELFINLENLIKGYFLHLTIVITDEDLQQYALSDILLLYRQLQQFIRNSREALHNYEKTPLGYYISAHIPLYPLACRGQETESENSHASTSASEDQKQQYEDSNNTTEQLIELFFSKFDASAGAKKDQGSKFNNAKVSSTTADVAAGPNLDVASTHTVGAVLSPQDTKTDMWIVPAVHCLVLQLLPGYELSALSARVRALQLLVAQRTNTEIGFTGSADAFTSATPLRSIALATQRSELHNSDQQFRVSESNVNKLSSSSLPGVQIGAMSANNGSPRGIAFGISGLETHDDVDAFLLRHHGCFRLDFIHISVTDLPNLRSNTIELCQRCGVDVVVSLGDDVFDAVVNAEEEEEEEEGEDHVEQQVQEQEDICEPREDEDNDECVDNGTDNEHDSEEVVNSQLPARDNHSSEDIKQPSQTANFLDASKVFDESAFFDEFDRLCAKYEVSLQTLLVQCLRQLGCIIRLKGVFDRSSLAELTPPPEQRSLVKAIDWRAEYLQKHYGRLVHPFVDRRPFVSSFRVISLYLEPDDMQTLLELSQSEEEVLDRQRVQNFLSKPQPKALDFRFIKAT